MASEAKTHPYHMVDPSPWPAVGTASGFTIAVGAIIYMHYDMPWLMLLGFLLLF